LPRLIVRLGRYDFRPSRWPTLVVLLVLPLLLSLGFWQLDRAEQKRAWLARHDAGRQQEAVDLNAVQPAYDAVAHRQAVVRGVYDPAHQVLLENQIRDRRTGYLVLTPLRIEGTGAVVLVDRGWLPASGDRRELPDLTLEAVEVTAHGVIDRGPSVGLKMGDSVVAEGWPLRVQYLDYQELDRRLPYPVLPYLIRLDPAQPHGYRRDWQPVDAMGPATHVGYAVQWFGLAIALVVIYLVVNTKRVESKDRD
jgi:surfeit locus 1 family protein